MNKDAADVAETLELLRPSPLLIGEIIDEFEEELESVIDKEWATWNKESKYYAS